MWSGCVRDGTRNWLGTTKVVLSGIWKQPALITAFSLVFLLSQVWIISEKGRPQGKKKQAAATSNPLKGSWGGRENSSHQPNHCVFCPLPSHLSCPPHQPTLLGTWNLWPKDHHHINPKIINHPPLPNPPKFIHPAFTFLNPLRTYFLRPPPPALSGVGWGGKWILSWLFFFFKETFWSNEAPQIIEFWVLVGWFFFSPKF